MEDMHPEILEASLPPTPITNNDSASSSSDQHVIVESVNVNEMSIDMGMEMAMESDMESVDITEMREDQKEIEAPSPPTPIKDNKRRHTIEERIKGREYEMKVTLMKTFVPEIPSHIGFTEYIENNYFASSSSVMTEQHQPKHSIIDIKGLEEWKQLMEFLGDHVDFDLKDIHIPVPQCCIYRVSKDLRKINEAAYTPQVISIGPLHHGEKEFFEMEKQKLRYMFEFSKRVGKEKLGEFKRFIEDKEQDIRNYYQETSNLPSAKFVNMVLHDAVFIIEVLLKYWLPDSTYDFFLYCPTVIVVILRDLQLLENQLPYFVLQKLIEQGAFHNVTEEEYPDHDPLLILSHNIFLNSKPGHNLPKPDHQILHFTDLRRYFLLMNFYPAEELGEMRDLPTATKLHSSGVKFKMGIEDSIEVSCKHVKNAIRIPGIKGLELRIPRFKIYDQTEFLYRNMMALEQCHYPRETHICNFIRLMDHLIDTVKDVDLLVDEGIIINSLGDNAAIATMFNKFSLQLVQYGNPSNSYNIGKKLKEHYDNRWNHTMATFKTVYFSDIWTGTATVAAVILLVLTFIQTVFSIKSWLSSLRSE